MGTEKFQELAEQTSAILRLAAHVNYAHSYANHRNANDLETATLLRLQKVRILCLLSRHMDQLD